MGLSAAEAGDAGVPAASGAVYHDRHETSLPLLAVGAAVTVSMAAQLGLFGTINIGWDWATGAAQTIALMVVGLTFRGRAAQRGMKSAPGLGLAVIIGLAALVSPFVLVLFYAGPFIVFGPGLVAAGLRLRNRFLAGWAAVIGVIGIFEGFFGITNRLPYSLWAGWEHPGIYLVLGVLTVLAGIIIWVRERRAGRSGPG